MGLSGKAVKLGPGSQTVSLSFQLGTRKEKLRTPDVGCGTLSSY